MKRLHVHVAVEDLAASIRFYSVMFAAESTVAKVSGCIPVKAKAAASGCC